MSNEISGLFAELARDFQDKFGVNHETAVHMVGIFASAAAQYADEKQAEAAFTEASLTGLRNGEAWAKDYVDSYIRTQYSQAPAIVTEANSRGTDVAGALAAVYGISIEAAQGLADLLKARSQQ